jgi:mono/diheme cytochrome c family protein
MKRTLTTVIVTLGVALALALAAAAVVVKGGLYDVGAVTQHTQAVYALLETTMKHSVRRRAADIEPPPATPGSIQRGAAVYRDHCVQCHGGPGVAPGPVGMSMQPLPGPLLDAARRWRASELYWITRHGIRMSGMPAWALRLSEEDTWAVVHFIGRMPQMSPAEYLRWMAAVPQEHPASGSGATAEPAQPPQEVAQLALRQYACVACHIIPGLTGSQTHVGPSLEGLARRQLIAGRLPNTADNLVRWIRAPQSIKPGSAMPDLAVTEEHARLMAAYLSTLH